MRICNNNATATASAELLNSKMESRCSIQRCKKKRRARRCMCDNNNNNKRMLYSFTFTLMMSLLLLSHSSLASASSTTKRSSSNNAAFLKSYCRPYRCSSASSSKQQIYRPKWKPLLYNDKVQEEQESNLKMTLQQQPKNDTISTVESTAAVTAVVTTEEDEKASPSSSSSSSSSSTTKTTAETKKETSSTIGSLLLQMQNKLEEFESTNYNNNFWSPDQAINLDAGNNSRQQQQSSSSSSNKNKNPIPDQQESSSSSSSSSSSDFTSSYNMDTESAKELDDAILYLESSDTTEAETAETTDTDTDTKNTDTLSLIEQNIQVLETPEQYKLYYYDQEELLDEVVPSPVDAYYDTAAIPPPPHIVEVVDKDDKDKEDLLQQQRKEEQVAAAPLPQAQKQKMTDENYYQDRIGRDMRHLAVSIASSVDDIEQWKVFCEEKGGIMPLLMCIRESAKFIRENNQQQQQQQNNMQMQQTKTEAQQQIGAVTNTNNNNAFLQQQEQEQQQLLQEESFMAACNACRALRDLCAISPDVAAIITDGILRANAAWLSTSMSSDDENNGYGDDDLMSDFMIMLQHANEYTEPKKPTNAQRIRRSLGRNKRRLLRNKRKRIETLFQRKRSRRDARLRCKLYVTQLLLAMTVASDDAVHAIRQTNGLTETIVQCSSYTRSQQTRRWLRYPGMLLKYAISKSSKAQKSKSPKKILKSILKQTKGVIQKSSSSRKKDNKQQTMTQQQSSNLEDTTTTATNTSTRGTTSKGSSSDDNNASSSQNEKNGGGTTTTTTTARRRPPFVEAVNIGNDLDGHVRGTANQILAAVGYNKWVPKIPGQKGLRILCLDGGGSRGMTAVQILHGIVEAMEGVEVADSFDIIAGTSTGGIISFLTGLRRETSVQTLDRYDQLIKQIFVKNALAAPLMLFTTASYDESHFMGILSNILKDDIMLDSRANPAVPYVFCVASKMSTTPTHVALFRNYNYENEELSDPFTIDPMVAREKLGLPLESEHEIIRNSHYRPRKSSANNKINGDDSNYRRGGKSSAASRNPGSFRVLQRYALRASTAAPTVFKPIMMGGEMYCDGGIVASNPTAVAIHEARSLFPDVPIELVVSIGTGAFVEQKNSPRIGWDGIIGQIVDSATDGEQIHHVLEDILGEGVETEGRRGGGLRRSSHVSQTRYFRFNPILGLPDSYPIDVTEPAKLEELKQKSKDYLAEPEQQAKLDEMCKILKGRNYGWRKWLNV